MQRVAIKLFVLMAGVVLMLARTSPALAADSHDKSKPSDKTSASVVVNRSDHTHVTSDHPIGGGGGGDGKGDGGKDGASSKGGSSAKASSNTSANGSASASASVSASASANANAKANVNANANANANGK